MTLSTFSIMPDSAFWVGKDGPKQVAKGHANFDLIIHRLLHREDPTDLADVARSAIRSLDGRIAVEGGRVTLDGKPLEDDVLESHIVALAEASEDVQPFFKFIESLDRNPSRRAREQLFRFLRATGLTLLEDGRILAYKGVRDDYLDKHSGTFDNRPGNVHSMPRRNVDDDPNRTCSYGFHVGALSYARNWGARVVATAFSAEDAVSVPTDEQDRKLRVCSYEVLRDWEGEEPAGVPVWREDEDDDFGGESEAEPEADVEPKRFQVVMRALGDGLSGWVVYETDVEAEDEFEAETEAEHRFAKRFDFLQGEIETVSVTEL